jgi:serine protease Do
MAALPLQDMAKAAGPSVVHLSIRDADGEEDSSGSGFVISAEGGVATNYHVVDEAERMVAVFPDGRQVDVVGVRGYDKDSDVAVLQLAPGTYPPLKLAGNPGAVGDEIVVIGSPLGLGQSLSTGIIAALREHGTVTKGNKDGEESWQLQITAAIAPGSSGSPIMNAGGEVVGLAVGHMGDGVYFGVPVTRLNGLLAKPVALKSLAEFNGRRSVQTNLLISAGVFGAFGFAFWLLSARHRQQERASQPKWDRR